MLDTALLILVSPSRVLPVLLGAEGVKAEAAFAKDGTKPNPDSTDNHEFKIVLRIIRDGLEKVRRWVWIVSLTVWIAYCTCARVLYPGVMYLLQMGIWYAHHLIAAAAKDGDMALQLQDSCRLVDTQC